jgi:hypothetical protein
LVIPQRRRCKVILRSPFPFLAAAPGLLAADFQLIAMKYQLEALPYFPLSFSVSSGK